MLRSRPGEIQETHAATSFNLRPATSTQMLRSRPGEMRNPGDPRSRPEDLRKCCAAGPEKWEIQETHAAGPRIYANAAQQARRNEKSRRPTQQARGLATSQHICTSNFNNIFNPRLHASLAYLGLNIYSPVHIDNLNTSDNSEASKRPNGVISKRRMRSLLFLMPEWHSLFFARMA
jgi:hypothetical protein